jgi:cell division protein ZapA
MATAGKQPSTDAAKTGAVNPGATNAGGITPSAAMPRGGVNGAGAGVGSVRVEIFDQVYNLRGSDADYILKLAEYVDGKMRAVSEQTATVDSVRLAVLAALNIADEFHLLKRQLDTPSPEARQRASKLANALDEVLEDTRQAG